VTIVIDIVITHKFHMSHRRNMQNCQTMDPHIKTPMRYDTNNIAITSIYPPVSNLHRKLRLEMLEAINLLNG